MEKESSKDVVRAILEMLTGLLGVVDPALRAVAVDLDLDQELYISYFYYDGPIDEYRRELVSCAATEASASGTFCSDEHYIQLDFPASIPTKGYLVYLRKEPGLSPPKVKLYPRRPKVISKAYLAYALNQGLLGRVIPSLRCVLIGIDEKERKMEFYFYYDEEITEEIRSLSKEAIEIAKTAFPFDYEVLERIAFVPMPNPMPKDGSRMVYERNEHLYD